MTDLVLDSSVLFDLERGRLISAAFKLNASFVTPDLLLATELAGDPLADEILTLGLGVIDLDADEVQRAQEFGKKYPKLSRVDCWALVCALRGNARLLTGDGALREAAKAEKVSCSGVLWILEQLHSAGVTTAVELYEGLSTIKAHSRTRLPAAQVDTLLRKLERDMKQVREPLEGVTSVRLTETRLADAGKEVYFAQVQLVRELSPIAESGPQQGQEPSGAISDGAHPKKTT